MRLPFTVILLGAVAAHAQPSGRVSYHEIIQPMFQRTCQGCHHAASPGGELIITSYDGVMKGGKSGASILPGKPEESLLIKNVVYEEGDRPLMPVSGEPLTFLEIELLRRWIAEGAIDDTPAPEEDPIGPGHPPIYSKPPVISALSYSPDGAQLAVSGYREILLHKADGSEITGRLVGKAERIESIVFSADGNILAAVGGTPAQFGEVQIWSAQHQMPIRAVQVTFDSLYEASLSPDGSLLAFGAADTSARIFSVPEAEEKIRFDNHNGWVMGTVFSQDGKFVVTGSRDKAIKLLNAASGSFIDDINSSNKGYGPIHSIARHPSEDQVLIVGEDTVPRLYKIFRTERRNRDNTDFNLIRSYEKQRGAVNAVAFNADGSIFAVGEAAGEVRVYNTGSGRRLLKMDAVPGGVFALAFHPHKDHLATGGFDGRIRVFEAATGRLQREFSSVPLTAGVASLH